MMLVCFKQHLSNMWSPIHEKVNQHWSWVGKKRVLFLLREILPFEVYFYHGYKLFAIKAYGFL